MCFYGGPFDASPVSACRRSTLSPSISPGEPVSTTGVASRARASAIISTSTLRRRCSLVTATKLYSMHPHCTATEETRSGTAFHLRLATNPRSDSFSKYLERLNRKSLERLNQIDELQPQAQLGTHSLKVDFPTQLLRLRLRLSKYQRKKLTIEHQCQIIVVQDFKNISGSYNSSRLCNDVSNLYLKSWNLTLASVVIHDFISYLSETPHLSRPISVEHRPFKVKTSWCYFLSLPMVCCSQLPRPLICTGVCNHSLCLSRRDRYGIHKPFVLNLISKFLVNVVVLHGINGVPESVVMNVVLSTGFCYRRLGSIVEQIWNRCCAANVIGFEALLKLTDFAFSGMSIVLHQPKVAASSDVLKISKMSQITNVETMWSTNTNESTLAQNVGLRSNDWWKKSLVGNCAKLLVKLISLGFKCLVCVNPVTPSMGRVSILFMLCSTISLVACNFLQKTSISEHFYDVLVV